MLKSWNIKLVNLIIVSVCSVFTVACSKDESVEVVAPEVKVEEVKLENVPVNLEWLANIEGNTNATIRAQVEGYLIKQNYTEGSFVKKGDVLFEIDPRPFEAALDKANSELKQAEAILITASTDVKRYKPLVAQKAVSQRDLDNAIGREKNAEGQVEAAKALIETAKLNLEFTKVVAPIDGLAGVAEAQIGDLVGSVGGKPLTTVSSVDPIRVYVPVTEKQYLMAAKGSLEKKTDENGKTSETDEAGNGKDEDEDAPIPLTLILSGDIEYPHQGHFEFAERQVDTNTGTLKVAALFPNPDHLLRPGLSARVRASFTDTEKSILIPKIAITEVQGLARVYVVNNDNTVSIRDIKKGRDIDDLQVIESGLNENDRVIVSNTSQIKDGMTVTVKAE